MAFFHRSNVPLGKTESQNRETAAPKRSGARVAVLSVVLAFLALMVLLLGLRIKGIYGDVTSRWEELKFAYDKPELVRSLREDYQQRSAALDEAFLNRQQTAEQKLLEEVAVQLKESK